MSGARAVVFDCDGVLVDSEPISERAWSTVLGRLGYAPTDGDFAAIRGTTSADTLAYFERLVTMPPGVDIHASIGEVREALYDDELEAFPDAVGAVRALAAEGVPLAVASSSSRTTLDGKLARFDLHRYFDVTVAGDEVRMGKPAPDLFLAAASGMGVDPGACLAIDDTEIGADAAIAAGMRTVLLARDGRLSTRYTAVSELDAELVLHWLGLR
jgi:HAD superfamily hydrolase (TIGR01509 family)